MKATILFLLFFISYSCAAQQGKLLLKFSPLALVDEVSFPTIMAGVEYRISNKMSWYNEAGIKYRNSTFDAADSSFVKPGGFKIKSELRYYFNNKASFSFEGRYFAAAVFFTADRHNTGVDWHIINDTTVQADVFGVNRKTAGLNLLYGNQVPLSKKWLLDVYGGLGVRYRSIRTVNKEYNKSIHGLRGPIDVNIPFIRSKADAESNAVFMGSLSAGVRICYKL